MYNARIIIIGLVIVVGLLTLPLWINLTRQADLPEVSLDTPQIQALEVKKCIESTEYMRAHHMRLLAAWRDSVVREDDRIYIARDGSEYIKCMQQTCLHCHSNKTEFCDACHNYVGAELNCWDCHTYLQTSRLR